jgi:hypothetical protein
MPLVALSKGDATDSNAYVRTAEPLKLHGEEGAYDPRVLILQHFWASQGVPNVTVWGIKRIRPVEVLGQIKLVRLNTRWFAPHGVFRDLGANYVIREPDGTMRFLSPAQMALEFQDLADANGARIRSLEPTY